jgi:Methyltransferase FkbM domain
MDHPDTALSDIGFFSNVDGQAITVAAIIKVLGMLPGCDRWCVEFGAWDGMVGSNTRQLITEQSYKAVLIEGSKERFAGLLKNYERIPDIHAYNQFVGYSAGDNLDIILKKTPIPKDFDFLSVDIDGNDYHVWRAMTEYQPKVVIIEFNPTIPSEVTFVQEADPAVSAGCSLTALVELGTEKGYELIAVIGVNAIFVIKKLYPVFQIEDNSIEALWTKRDCVTYLFSGYDGRIFLRGCRKLPWHESIPMRESKMQVLPSIVRKYPHTRKNRIIYTCMTDPLTIVRKVLARFTRLFSYGGKNR